MPDSTNPPFYKTAIFGNVLCAIIASLTAIMALDWAKENAGLMTFLGVLLALANAGYQTWLKSTTTTLVRVIIFALASAAVGSSALV